MTPPQAGIEAEHRNAIDQFQQDRGWIVSSYAQVELLMADVIVRARELPDYQHVPNTPTFDVTKRAKRFRKLVEMPGPINADRESLLAVVSAWEASAGLRHFLVHGFATFRFTRSGDMMMTFRRYMSEFEPDPFREMHFRPDTMMEMKDAATAAASQAVAAFEALHQRLGWVGPGDMPMRGNAGSDEPL